MRCLAPPALILLVATAVGAGRPQAEVPAPRVALIIDDFGYAYGPTARAFLELDCDLTISVLPGETFSTRIAERVRAAGKDLFLHLPMEPLEYPEEDPGPRAIFVAQTDEEVRALVRSALGAFEGLDGVNNHMGSRAMQDERILRIVLDEVGKRDLLFLDSKTVAGRLARRLAGALGVTCLENDLFWDSGYDSREEILENLDRLAEIARARGRAIGIGHPREATLEALVEKIPEMRRSGIRLVRVRDLLKDPPGGAGSEPSADGARVPAAPNPLR
ncbi:MAG: divergent polysaccharide deacetylase family protein [Candidatus Eisenbacteria bacterium]|nr:divergent polysaccharide deacetylase family protein [Candidatus Eisenbacteria bacterium]